MEDILKREAYHKAKALLLDGDDNYKVTKVAELLEQLKQLKEERKELVEALREMYHDKQRNFRFNNQEKIESLLSKVKQ